jgi:hypothetical protein
MFIFLGEHLCGIGLKFRENKEELLEASVVDGLEKAALFDTIGRRYFGSGKIILLEFLKEISA